MKRGWLHNDFEALYERHLIDSNSDLIVWIESTSDTFFIRGIHLCTFHLAVYYTLSSAFFLLFLNRNLENYFLLNFPVCSEYYLSASSIIHFHLDRFIFWFNKIRAAYKSRYQFLAILAPTSPSVTTVVLPPAPRKIE